MSIDMSPVTVDKLQRLERRRRRFIILRGLCAATVSLLLFVFIVAGIDWLWVLPDRVRWALSAIGYLSVAIIVWMTCLRRIARSPGSHELARHVERAEPRLREKLLAAIELCLSDLSRLRDSAAFRRVLQEQVGRQMATVDVRGLLPLRLLQRWLLAALLLIVACLALFSVPELPFKQLMTRALLPGANIDRVSRVQVTILEPTPHSTIAAHEEPLAVVVTTSGAEVSRVTLETQSPTGATSRQTMQHLGGAKFSTNVEIGSETIQYRILAGDAVTRWYTIRSRPRPVVRLFRKTLHYPAYAQLEDTTVSEANGDLIALQGTAAHLILELDQAVSEAEIRLRQIGSDDVVSVPLNQSGPKQYEAVIPIDEPSVYKVRLVSRETGFENTFSPNYEIRPEPDLIPRVSFVNLADTTLLLPANDILDLHGMADDDLPLVSVDQQFSVNGETWQTHALKIALQRHVTVAWQWDLLDLKLKAGDQITTRLVARDRKGNLGESVPLQIVIAEENFDPNRHKDMLRKVTFYDHLADLAEGLQRRAERVTQLVADLDRPDSGQALLAEKSTSIADLVDKTGEELTKIDQEIKQSLAKTVNPVDATEMALAGRTVLSIRDQMTRNISMLLELARFPANTEKPHEDFRVAAVSFAGGAEAMKTLATRFQTLVAYNILAATVLDLDGILQHQCRLIQAATPLSWQRLVRQETVVLNQIRILEQLVRDNMSRLPATAQRSMLRLLDWARSARTSIEQSSESEEQLAALRRAADSIAGSVEREEFAVPLNSSLVRQVTTARKALDQDAGSLFEPLRDIAESAAQRSTLVARAGQASDSASSQQLQRDIQRLDIRLSSHAHAKLAGFSALRALVLAQPRSDPRFAADLNLTRRAVLGLLADGALAENTKDNATAIDVPKALAEIAPAYRVLEAGHAIVDMQSLLTQLLVRERWEALQIPGLIESPRQWDTVCADLELAVARLKAAGYPADITSVLDRLRWAPAVREAGRKIAARGPDHRRTVNAVYELMQVQSTIATASEEIQPIIAAARAVIARYAPSIVRMARQAAARLRQLEDKTATLSEDVKLVDRELATTQMQDVQQEQQSINRQLGDLTRALADDANAQDLMTEQGRERARDADDSRAAVQQSASQMGRAVQQAVQSDQADQQARNLTEAATQQGQSARMLDQIANHFQRLDAGQDATASRDALRQTEQALGIQRALDQQYQEAKRLGEMAGKTPQQLMAELEAELPKNPAMQQALSDISRNAIQQAKNRLEYSADQEETTRRAMERSDRQFQAAKEALTRQLLDIGKKASDLNRTLVAQANSAAGRTEPKDARAQLQEAQQHLAQAATRTTKVDSSQLLEDVTGAAREMAEQLGGAAENLQQSERATAQAATQPTKGGAEQRTALQREMETAQKRLRDQLVREARDQVRQLQQQEKRTERDVKSAESRLRSAERQVNKMAVTVRLNPDSTSAKNNLEQATKQWRASQEAVAQATQQQENARQQTKEMENAARELQKAELKPLTAPNPAAELANRLSQEAAAVAEDLAEQAKRLARAPDWSEQLDPSSSQLTQAAAAQTTVGEDVMQAAADVERAGRHEQRLGNKEVGERLAQTGGDIQQVADKDVAGAAQQLGRAAEQKSGDASTPPDAAQHAATQAGRSALRQAQESIAQQAESLDKILNPQQTASTPPAPAAAQPGTNTSQAASSQAASSQTASSQTVPGQAAEQAAVNPSSAPSSPSSSGPAESRSGQQLARTLDELDQAMAASPTGADPSNSSASAGQQPARLPSVAQAAQAQATQMARQRMQDNASIPSPPSTTPAEQSGMGADVANMGEADTVLPTVDRQDDGSWGQLRGKMAEDLVEGQGDTVSAEYRKQVQVYFRVIAERARQRRLATEGSKQ